MILVETVNSVPSSEDVALQTQTSPPPPPLASLLVLCSWRAGVDCVTFPFFPCYARVSLSFPPAAGAREAEEGSEILRQGYFRQNGQDHQGDTPRQLTYVLIVRHTCGLTYVLTL